MNPALSQAQVSVTSAPEHQVEEVDIGRLGEIGFDRGVAALVCGEQVAVFVLRAANGEVRVTAGGGAGDDVEPGDVSVHAVANHDPFSGANVIARGLVGSVGDAATVASPIYKQRFDLVTGRCLDDDAVSLAVYPVRLTSQGRVVVARRPLRAGGPRLLQRPETMAPETML